MKRLSFRVESSKVVSTVACVGGTNVIIVVDMCISGYSRETGLVEISNSEKMHFP